MALYCNPIIYGTFDLKLFGIVMFVHLIDNMLFKVRIENYFHIYIIVVISQLWLLQYLYTKRLWPLSMQEPVAICLAVS